MKFTWGHGVVTALAAFILFILGMIFLFPNGQKNSELITENYYEEELAYQNVIDAKNRADQLEKKPEVQLKNSGILISFPSDINTENSKFSFELFRTDDKNLDVKKDFVPSKSGTFEIPNKVLVKGSYTLKLKWTKDKKDYQIDYDILWK